MTTDEPPLELLLDGPDEAALTLALGHGAGAPMDAPFLARFARSIARRGFRVVRFEFPYMRRRRLDGRRRPPDKPAVLESTWREVVRRLGSERLVVGGKSMGGRIASQVVDGVDARGLVCLGYPFHPPRRPETLRIAHLEEIETPTLIVQGTRDPFGRPSEVAGYPLSSAIRLAWIEDGDHSFKPRVRSGRTPDDCLEEAVERVADFLGEITGQRRQII